MESSRGCKRLTPAGLVREPFRPLRRAPVLFATAATVVVHLALLLAAPAELIRGEPGEHSPRPSLEVVLDPPPEPDAPPEESFIVPNPEVPSHPPDEAEHFAERDQQAAQEEPAEEDLGMPEVEGDFEEPTQNIVEGIEVEPVPMEDWDVFGDDFGLPGIEGRPIEGFEPVEGEEGIDVPVTEEAVEESEELQTALDLDGLFEEGEETEAGVDEEETVQVPQPRPRLSQASRDPVGNRPGAVSRVGTVAVDANFSEFGDYLTRMLEAIQRKWHDLAWDSLPAGEVGSVVAVSFQIDREGKVRGLEVDRSTAGLTATLICKDAITSREPYGSWSSEMREVLGEEQTVRIRFHYR